MDVVFVAGMIGWTVTDFIGNGIISAMDRCPRCKHRYDQTGVCANGHRASWARRDTRVPAPTIDRALNAAWAQAKTEQGIIDRPTTSEELDAVEARANIILRQWGY